MNVSESVAPATVPSLVNHVFVDFENVHDFDPAVGSNKAVRYTLLLGPLQSRIEVATVEKILSHAPNVELVRITSSGKNAVDFALTYYLGRAVREDPTGYFHIVSKDTGFDPLVEHLRSKSIHAHRHDGFETLTFGLPVKPAVTAEPTLPPKPKPKSAAKPKRSPAVQDERVALMGSQVLAWPEPSTSCTIPNERTALMLEHLRKNANNRPKRKTTLIKHVRTFFGNKITEVEAVNIVEALQRSGCLAINEKGATLYSLERD